MERARAAAVRKYSFGQRICIDVHVLVEHGFKYAAQIERRLEVAIVQERPRLQARPVGDHLSAANRATQEECTAASAVIGAARAVDGRGPAEFRDDQNRCLRPERAQPVGQ